MTHETSDPLERLLQKRRSELEAWREHELKVKAQPPLRPQPTPADHATAEDFWRDFAAWQAEKAARLESYPSPLVNREVALVEIATGADGSIIYAPPDFEGRAQ